MTRALVFGASGAIGRFLLPRLEALGSETIAISRTPQGARDARTRWLIGALPASVPALPPVDVIYSLGPLDAFARWFAQASVAPARVIAIGSMSADSKRASTDPAERALAARLGGAEVELAAAAAARGCRWTVLRPTLIYGAGVDRSLSPIARLADRWRVFPLLPGAHGLRQPVHADDLAGACVAAAASDAARDRVYALGGGERLAFAQMLHRVRHSLPHATLPLPIPLAALPLLAQRGRLSGFGASAVARLRTDLVADHAAAAVDFGWSPRAFHPDAQAWGLPS